MPNLDFTKIVSIMKASSLPAYLATVEGDEPRVRPVTPIVEDDMSIWVATFATSRKSSSWRRTRTSASRLSSIRTATRRQSFWAARSARPARSSAAGSGSSPHTIWPGISPAAPTPENTACSVSYRGRSSGARTGSPATRCSSLAREWNRASADVPDGKPARKSRNPAGRIRDSHLFGDDVKARHSGISDC